MPAASPRLSMLIVPLAALVFLAGLGRGKIVTSHEARVAATAATMAESGWPWSARPVSVPLRLESRPPQTLAVNPWLIPVFNREMRLQKPPLPYWCTAALYRLMGASEMTSRLVPALMGLAGALLLYDLARALSGRRSARWAALAWVSTLFIAEEYRKAMADPYLAFFALASFWAWVRAASPRPDGGRAAGFLALFYLSVALGLLAKGPVLLLHVLVPVGLHTMLYRRAPRASWLQHAAGTGLALLLALPWPVYVAMHVPGVVQVWRYESVGEFADNVRNARPWFFYVPAMLELSLPWTPLWAAGLWAAVQRPRRHLLLPVLWCAVIVLVFSFAHMKKNAYMLPLMPAQALIIGRTIAMAEAWSRRGLRGRWPKLLLDAQVIVGVALGLGIAALALLGPVEGRHSLQMWLRSIAATPALNIAGAILALAAALIPLNRHVCRTLTRRAAVQACCCAVLVVVTIVIVNASKHNQRKAVVDFGAAPPAPKAAMVGV